MGKEINVDEVLGKSLALSNNGNNIVRDLPLLSLNHVSYVCKSVRKSVEFYEQVLGFVLIQRPSSFDFEGAWLFNHGIGIHLLQSENVSEEEEEESRRLIRINPKDNHISFQCTDMDLLIRRLSEMGIEHVKAVVREGGVIVDQIFFHDPDGYMIEICNCQNLPVLPLSSASSCPLPLTNNNNVLNTNIDLTTSSLHLIGKNQCGGEMEGLMMMDNLAMDMLNFSN